MGEYAIPFARRDHSSSSPPLGQNQRQRPSEGSFAIQVAVNVSYYLQERVQKGAQMENLAHRKEWEIWLPHVLQVTFPTSETPGSLLPPPFVSNSAPGKTSPCRLAGLKMNTVAPFSILRYGSHSVYFSCSAFLEPPQEQTWLFGETEPRR